MKKRIGVLLLACLISLSLMPAAAQAALNESYPYEVTPFRIEDFSPNPGNATYVGSTAPEIEVREMTIDGNTENVSVFPAGTKFSGMGEVSFGNTVTYMNGEPDYSTYYSGRDPLPAQGVYRIEVYSNYYGYLFGYVWVTAEGSDSAEPEPEQPADPEQPGLPAQVFSEVDPNAWYAGFVNTVTEKGLFSGNPDGTFAPNANMTYAQFLVVLSQFSGETVTPVEGGAWYEGYVNWAQPLIPAGMAEDFDPNAAITRQDMAALFGTFLNAYDYSAEPVNQDDPAFTDAASIADYADSGVELCYQLGIMSGKDNNRFDPAGTTTRAEVAVTMTQMARVMGR